MSLSLLALNVMALVPGLHPEVLPWRISDGLKFV